MDLSTRSYAFSSLTGTADGVFAKCLEMPRIRWKMRLTPTRSLHRQMKLTSNYAKLALLCQGIILIGMGLYVIILRPPVLREDLNFIQTNTTAINDGLPRLLLWLKKVFIVLGGYIFASGLLLSYLSMNETNKQTTGWIITIIVAGTSSIGLMTIINFMINSDFKWLLLFFNLPWLTSLGLTICSGISRKL
jgi:hypothetical protein